MKPSEKRVYARTVGTPLFTACWLLSIVNCGLVQFQVWVLSGSALIPGLTAKISLLIPIVTTAMLAPCSRLHGSLRRLYFPMLLSLIASFSIAHSRSELTFSQQVTAFFTNYFFLLLAPLCLLSKPFIDLRRIFRLLVIVWIPLTLLGIAQHFLADPIVPTESADGSLFITSWNFYGSIRAFSLFASGLDFSYFLAIMMPFFLACFVTRRVIRNRILCGAAIGATALATYSTLTRNAYLFVLQSGLAAIFLVRSRPIGAAKWFSIPLAGAFVAVLAIVVAPLMAGNVDRDILQSQSLTERLLHWADAAETWTGQGLSMFLFGDGQSQGVANPEYIVDNTFLNFAVQSGLAGLLAATTYLYAIWMSLRKVVIQQPSPGAIAICAFFSTWMLSGTFSWSNSVYALVSMALFASPEYDVGEARSEQTITRVASAAAVPT